MDEIQNNPNVPDDVKAAINGALLLTTDEDDGYDEEEARTSDNNNEAPALPIVDELETFDDDYIMDYIDGEDKKAYKGRRKEIDDEDWQCKIRIIFLLSAIVSVRMTKFLFTFYFRFTPTES